MPTWIDQLYSTRCLPAQGYAHLLTTQDVAERNLLLSLAGQVARAHFGKSIYIRGLIEVSNYCKNNCFYCGIRCANREIERYRLSQDEILSCCAEGYALGMRTFVLQGGEDPMQTTAWFVSLIQKIRESYPTCAITLSLGEKSKEDYQALFDAGANRYLLRHETITPSHYSQLHPKGMSLERRIKAIHHLMGIGFQTGTGIMVGSPKQEVAHLVADLLFIQELQTPMVGLGPFIPHHATPFAHEPAGSLELTLRVLALCRLMHPQALIPATTALASLGGWQARLQAIKNGANVVMPNLSPFTIRKNYALYDGKAYNHSESAQGLKELSSQLTTIGYTINFDRGDYTTESMNP